LSFQVQLAQIIELLPSQLAAVRKEHCLDDHASNTIGRAQGFALE
jgi:hypothetical protein